MSEREGGFSQRLKSVTRHPIARASVAMLAVSSMVSGCSGESKIYDGTAVSKQHHDAKDWTDLVPFQNIVCEPVGKTEDCTTTFTYVPESHHTDEEWIVKLQKCQAQTAEADKPKCQTQDFYVSQNTWNGINVGDYVNFGKDKKSVSTQETVVSKKAPN